MKKRIKGLMSKIKNIPLGMRMIFLYSCLFTITSIAIWRNAQFYSFLYALGWWIGIEAIHFYIWLWTTHTPQKYKMYNLMLNHRYLTLILTLFFGWFGLIYIGTADILCSIVIAIVMTIFISAVFFIIAYSIWSTVEWKKIIDEIRKCENDPKIRNTDQYQNYKTRLLITWYILRNGKY